MDSAEEIKIPVPWGYICGKWWGPRVKQPLLALHGWQENAGSFDRLIPLFPDHISVLCIDLPGHGRSSHYPKGQFYYLFWDGVLVVRRIVKHFRWKRVSIMGHSLGGAIGFLYAASFPDEVEKLICFDIVHPSVRDLSRTVNETGQCIDKFLEYENMKEAGKPCYVYNDMIDLVWDTYRGSLTRECCEVLMKRGMAPAYRAFSEDTTQYQFCRDARLKIAGMGALTIDLVLEYASKIRCEYLNIKGIPGMKFDHPENYFLVLDKIKKTAKHFEFYEVEGTHHFHINTPELISSYVIDFLSR
ncbi:probable serine hydrolase [Anabrus simplex]|uniref:probable serine hydrolase n=1 Tax=Anabrus simplex TaxID=316456 RepID=UPI0034DD0C00